jgi:hypothetical protein
MTCIVWTPQGMAADRQASNGGTLYSITKLQRLELNGEIFGIATCGDADWGAELIAWYMESLGGNAYTYPLNDKEFKARLLVGSKTRLLDYCNRGYPVVIEDKYAAFGSCRDVALGAMYMGATPRQAIEAATFHLEDCGRGIDEVAF